MAFVLIYIDPSIAANSGAGTIGDPYGDIQWALNNATAGANGNILNIKAGTSEILTGALDWATFGAPTSTNPCIVRGYTSASEDGGIGSIDCAATYSLLAATTYDYLSFIDMELFNFGSAEPIHLNNYCNLINCEIHTTSHTSYIIDFGAHGFMENCHVHTLSGTGQVLLNTTGSTIRDCLFDIGGTKTFGPLMNGTGGVICNTAVKSSNASLVYGIRLATTGETVAGCSVYNSAACTGDGILLDGLAGRAINSIIEGFSGAGANGIASTNAGLNTVIAGNQIYNCTTEISETNPSIFKFGNVSLGASPFADPANDDFTVDTSVKAVGYPSQIGVSTSPTYVDAGACQREEAGGGGTTIIVEDGIRY